MTCKDCLHEQCYQGDIDDIEICNFFIDKNRYVEVVRCKDCKHYKTSPLFSRKQGKYCYKVLKDNGIAVGHGFKENDFCSYGERRVNNEN